MRAHTITTTTPPRGNAWHRVLVLALGICTLAVPASAGADPADYPSYRSPEAVIASADSSGPLPYRSPEAVIASADSSGPPAYRSPEALLSSAGSVSGSPASELTMVSAPPAGSGDEFDWADAALGAGAAVALVALGGAALLTVRRRTTITPSATTS